MTGNGNPSEMLQPQVLQGKSDGYYSSCCNLFDFVWYNKNKQYSFNVYFAALAPFDHDLSCGL